MNFGDDKHLDVCQNIEVSLKLEYQNNLQLTDGQCIRALDNAKIAIKHRFGYAPNEHVSGDAALQGVIAHCVAVGLDRIDQVNALTLKEYVARLEKIKSSVATHAQGALGGRSYFEFIKNFV
jgi:hypothetical protein